MDVYPGFLCMNCHKISYVFRRKLSLHMDLMKNYILDNITFTMTSLLFQEVIILASFYERKQ